MPKKNNLKIFILTILCAAGLAGIPQGRTLAHGDDMTTQAADSGKYHIEFEYDDTGPVYDRQEFNYTFRLEDKSTGNESDFGSVFVEFIRPQIGISGTATLQPIDKGIATMGLTLPTPDTYTVNLTFYDQDKNKLAEASFTQAVKENQAFVMKNPLWKKYLWVGTLACGLIIGFALGFLLKRKKSYQNFGQ